MRHNQKLTLEDLRAAAAAAVEESGRSQSDLARDFDVSRSAISRALGEANSALVSLQRRIIDALTDYEVLEEPEVRYTVKRKSKV